MCISAVTGRAEARSKRPERRLCSKANTAQLLDLGFRFCGCNGPTRSAPLVRARVRGRPAFALLSGDTDSGRFPDPLPSSSADDPCRSKGTSGNPCGGLGWCAFLGAKAFGGGVYTSPVSSSWSLLRALTSTAIDVYDKVATIGTVERRVLVSFDVTDTVLRLT